MFPNAEFYLDYEHALVFERIGEDKEIDLDYHTVINGVAYDGTFTSNMELKETVELMNSEDYKERFVAEYRQVKIRYEKLKNFCNKIEVETMLGKEVTKHDCPLELLREQQKYMGLYLSVLEKRALIENIVL